MVLLAATNEVIRTEIFFSAPYPLDFSQVLSHRYLRSLAVVSGDTTLS